MNILIIGSGGREHAFAWKIKKSPLCEKLFIAPGNPGTKACGTNLDINTSDFEGIKNAIAENKITLVVVGPEDPLVKGLYDFLAADPLTAHVNVIGPSAAAARLEGSKAFAKAFMKRNNIPTASYREFNIDNYEEGIQYINQQSLPIVLKADGLAAGKGVLICTSHEEARSGFEEMIKSNKFGEAGKTVVVESFLKGIEMSLFVLTDGQDFCILPEAKDYKRVGEGDTGPNTGGMGAVSPVPFFDEALKNKIISRIIQPTLKGLQEEKSVYKGFIFLGLMVDNGEPYMIEYNCRMGDPETEVVLPRIQNDLVELLVAAGNKKLSEQLIQISPLAAATTIMVSGGYPGEYVTGKTISGLTEVKPDEALVFHAGTRFSDEGIVTNGGRVLAVSAFGKNIQQAAAASLKAVSIISFEGMYYRKDIGFEF